MKALILAGGDLHQSSFVQNLKADFIVAADSGLHHAKTLGLRPDLIVGDFDSVNHHILAEYPDIPTQRFSEHKDLLDIEIALQAALQQGASSFQVIGAIGSRLDQSLAIIFIASNLRRKGFEISIHGKQDVFFLTHEHRTFPLPENQLFSLLSLDPMSKVSLENALYPLQNAALPFGVGLGVSNRLRSSPLHVTVQEGLVAVILEYDS